MPSYLLVLHQDLAYAMSCIDRISVPVYAMFGVDRVLAYATLVLCEVLAHAMTR